MALWNAQTQEIADEGKKETTTRHINDNADSLEIGTPSKGGAIKIYGDYRDTASFMEKIDRAIDMRKYAAAKMGD